jgi:hypothetical protein
MPYLVHVFRERRKYTLGYSNGGYNLILNHTYEACWAAARHVALGLRTVHGAAHHFNLSSQTR